MFVFGLAGGISSTKTVALVATQNSSGGLEVVVHGGPDLDKVRALNVTVDGSIVATVESPDVGQVVGAASPGDDVSGKRVIVVGEFTDGSEAILIDKSF